MAVFIGDYRPTKRVGIEEMDGCIKLLSDKLDEVADSGEVSTALYMGALIAMETIRHGRFEYPQDFMAVFDNRVKELRGE
jgi:hypothetical protein